MAAKDPRKALLTRCKQQRAVPEPIASETWSFKDRKGRKHTARIEVGRPQQVPDGKSGEWFCPVFIEGWTPHVIPATGLGSLDSLMNATAMVKSFGEYVASFQIRIGTSKATRRGG
jgi:hypothetical protein